jgi:hypothetical protein
LALAEVSATLLELLLFGSALLLEDSLFVLLEVSFFALLVASLLTLLDVSFFTLLELSSFVLLEVSLFVLLDVSFFTLLELSSFALLEVSLFELLEDVSGLGGLSPPCPVGAVSSTVPSEHTVPAGDQREEEREICKAGRTARPYLTPAPSR